MLKNKFFELYLSSLAVLVIGLFEMSFYYTKSNVTEGSFLGITILLIGGGSLVFTIICQVRYNTNRKQLERELSREYDERDDIIQGKVSHLTMRILMVIIIFIMFLSKGIAISTNSALSVIIVISIITNTLAKKYYNYFL